MRTYIVEEEKQLQNYATALEDSKRPAFFGKSELSRKKFNRLNLEVVVQQIPQTTTSNVLPNVNTYFLKPQNEQQI